MKRKVSLIMGLLAALVIIAVAVTLAVHFMPALTMSSSTTSTSPMTPPSTPTNTTPNTPANTTNLNATAPHTTTPPQTPTTPTNTTPTPPSPPVTPPPSPPASTQITYDFDTGTPLLAAGQGTPFTQTIQGVIATFSSPADSDAFSIQNHDTTFYVLPQFSGNYLWDSYPYRTDLNIQFSQPIKAITLTFATVDQYAAGEHDSPSSLELDASLGTSPAGIATAHGVFSSSTFPQGNLSFTSAHQFDHVKIWIPPQTYPASQFFIDTVIVTT